MNGEGEISSNVVRVKYVVKDDDGAHFRGRQRTPQVWKGIVWGRIYRGRGLSGMCVMEKGLVSGRMCGWGADHPLKRELLLWIRTKKTVKWLTTGNGGWDGSGMTCSSC